MTSPIDPGSSCIRAARRVGLTRERVRQIEAGALRKLNELISSYHG